MYSCFCPSEPVKAFCHPSYTALFCPCAPSGLNVNIGSEAYLSLYPGLWANLATYSYASGERPMLDNLTPFEGQK